VSGGAGIAKNLNVDGNLNVTGAITGDVTGDIIGNITGNVTGNLIGTATNATNINISATTSTDTSTSIVLVADQSTGNQSPFIDSGLSYNASNNTLTASTFVGTLSNLLTLNTSGTGLSGSTTYNNSGVSTFTVTSNATSANTGGTIVARDGSGNFSAGTITAATLNVTGISTFQDKVYVGTAGGSSALNIVGYNAYGGTGYHGFLTVQNTNVNLSKYFRLNSAGGFEIVNNAYNAVLFGLDDSGNLTVTGDITAFASDIRLKTNIEPIQNALDKVLALSGFTYNFNEIGESLGFDTSIRHSGVSAQEVQAVLPEVVAPAPASDEYITVKYEKLVPLLIEAIKELKAEINELKGVK
jgi:hypothetical protein